jgi:hypothetical protein
MKSYTQARFDQLIKEGKIEAVNDRTSSGYQEILWFKAQRSRSPHWRLDTVSVRATRRETVRIEALA